MGLTCLATCFVIDEQKILDSIRDGTHDEGVDAVIMDDVEKCYFRDIKHIKEQTKSIFTKFELV